MADDLDIAGVATAVYNLLKPLDPGDRQRIVRAAQALLGDVSNSSHAENADVEQKEAYGGGVAPKARVWFQKNGLTDDALSQVFHLDGGRAEIIAGDVPGKSGREKAINAYVLTGARELILTGDTKFDDKSARDVCRALGCYNDTNHATYIKDKGNLLAGSKGSGWTLTAPGLKAAADLIKEIANT